MEELHNFQQIIFIALNPKHQIENLSAGAEQYLGNSLARLKGIKLDQILPQDHPIIINIDREGRFSLFDQKYFLLNASSEFFDIHQFSNDGTINILLYAKPARIDQDLSESARIALRQASSMAAMLGHEIRNPLSAIKGATQLLWSTSSPENQELLQVIEEENERIGRMVNDFEDMAGEAPSHKISLNIHLVLGQVLRAAMAGFSREIKFIETYDPSLPEISADPDRLQRALSNIIKNSSEAILAKFGENADNGRITISTRYRGGLRRGDAELPVELTITDNGGGVDEAILSDIFKPFVTTKTNGTGLGLSHVARIIEDIGGVIEMSNTNQGCETRMLLPIWRD